MAQFEVKVKVHADDIIMAGIAQQGIQNVLDELKEHQNFLIDLSDRNVAKGYKDKIMGIMNNPMVQKLAGIMK